eukprot:CAMPEP_0117484208 /NCGR_PEP_ID=MMETSP0784-20121206/14341_1 /TAXON_ID=39447 /ORGANISM="" /LENGTH=826 /DNA_ID=CAMNT_0005278777 /DNA_START=110 /DNA_END=2590 /DNA_ORIENTATION=-
MAPINALFVPALATREEMPRTESVDVPLAPRTVMPSVDCTGFMTPRDAPTPRQRKSAGDAEGTVAMSAAPMSPRAALTVTLPDAGVSRKRHSAPPRLPCLEQIREEQGGGRGSALPQASAQDDDSDDSSSDDSNSMSPRQANGDASIAAIPMSPRADLTVPVPDVARRRLSAPPQLPSLEKVANQQRGLELAAGMPLLSIREHECESEASLPEDSEAQRAAEHQRGTTPVVQGKLLERPPGLEGYNADMALYGKDIWRKYDSDTSFTSPCNLVASLENLLGTWGDRVGSTYVVTPDGGSTRTCSVKTIRPNRKVRFTKRLIRAIRGRKGGGVTRVMWGKNFVLKTRKGCKDKIVWVPLTDRGSCRAFYWTRRCDLSSGVKSGWSVPLGDRSKPPRAFGRLFSACLQGLGNLPRQPQPNARKRPLRASPRTSISSTATAVPADDDVVFNDTPRTETTDAGTRSGRPSILTLPTTSPRDVSMLSSRTQPLMSPRVLSMTGSPRDQLTMSAPKVGHVYKGTPSTPRVGCLDAGQDLKASLGHEIEALSAQRDEEQRQLELVREELMPLKQKLQRCREVVASTAASVDRMVAKHESKVLAKVSAFLQGRASDPDGNADEDSCSDGRAEVEAAGGQVAALIDDIGGSDDDVLEDEPCEPQEDIAPCDLEALAQKREREGAKLQGYRNRQGVVNALLQRAREVVLTTVQGVDRMIAESENDSTHSGQESAVRALVTAADAEAAELLSELKEESDDSESQDRADSPGTEAMQRTRSSLGKDVSNIMKKRQRERVKLDECREERDRMRKKLQHCREVVAFVVNGMNTSDVSSSA